MKTCHLKRVLVHSRMDFVHHKAMPEQIAVFKARKGNYEKRIKIHPVYGSHSFIAAFLKAQKQSKLEWVKSRYSVSPWLMPRATRVLTDVPYLIWLKLSYICWRMRLNLLLGSMEYVWMVIFSALAILFFWPFRSFWTKTGTAPEAIIFFSYEVIPL